MKTAEVSASRTRTNRTKKAAEGKLSKAVAALKVAEEEKKVAAEEMDEAEVNLINSNLINTVKPTWTSPPPNMVGKEVITIPDTPPNPDTPPPLDIIKTEDDSDDSSDDTVPPVARAPDVPGADDDYDSDTSGSYCSLNDVGMTQEGTIKNCFKNMTKKEIAAALAKQSAEFDVYLDETDDYKNGSSSDDGSNAWKKDDDDDDAF